MDKHDTLGTIGLGTIDLLRYFAWEGLQPDRKGLVR
jgi:hypothetical protein